MKLKQQSRSKCQDFSFNRSNSDMQGRVQFMPEKPSRFGALLFSVLVAITSFILVFFVITILTKSWNILSVVIGIIAAAFIASTVHIAMEWERFVIFRMGNFHRVAGPGVILMIPVLEQIPCRVDVRTITTTFSAERTLTADLVPLNIDAVLFWMVWDAEKAAIEVEDYYSAVSFIAQTTMRDAIGRSSVAEVVLSRDQLDSELKEIIEKETEDWGIAILSVKIRDIVLPEELQESMSLEAQAEREKNARVVLAEAEQEIAALIAESAEEYKDNDAALQVRALHILYESIKKSNGTVVAVPTKLSDKVEDSESIKNIVNKLTEIK